MFFYKPHFSIISWDRRNCVRWELYHQCPKCCLLWASCSASHPMRYCNLNQVQEAIPRCKEVDMECDSQRFLALGMLGINKRALKQQIGRALILFFLMRPLFTGETIIIPAKVTQSPLDILLFKQLLWKKASTTKPLTNLTLSADCVDDVRRLVSRNHVWIQG